MKILFVIVTSAILAGQWAFDAYILHSNSFNDYISSLEFFITPLYLLIMVSLFLKQEYKSPLATHSIVVVHYILLIAIYTASAIIVPVFVASLTFRAPEVNGKALLARYQYADLMQDDVEADAYFVHYKKHQNKIQGFNIEEKNIKGIPSRQEKFEKRSLEKNFYNPLITSKYLQELSKEELLFNAKLYFESSYYNTTKILLLYYRQVYGEDEQLLEISNILDDYLSNTGGISFENLRVFHKNSILETIYYVINSKTVSNNDLIVSYHILFAFIEDNANVEAKMEAERIKKILMAKLEKRLFFAGDARINLFSLKDKRNITFIENKGSSNIIWIAKHSAYNATEDAVYFENLELIEISRLDNTIVQHIKTPYAKLQEHKLYLGSIERFALGIKYQPFLLVDNREINTIAPETTMDTSVSTAEAQVLVPSTNYIDELSIVDIANMLPIWEKYLLPTHMLFEVLVRLLVQLSVFAIFGLIIIRILHATSVAVIQYKHCIGQAMLIIASIVPLTIVLETVLVHMLRIFPNDWGRLYFLIITGVCMLLFAIANVRLSHQRTLAKNQ